MEIIRVDKAIHQRNLAELKALRLRTAELETFIEGVSNQERESWKAEVSERDDYIERLEKQKLHYQGQLRDISNSKIYQWTHDSVKGLGELKTDLENGTVSNEDAAIRIDLYIGHLTRNE